MKQLFLLFLFSLCYTFGFAQTTFNRGFNIGYKEGYCHNETVCTPPIPPMAPMPTIHESSNSYQDGYNRGFKVGLEHKQRKQTERAIASSSRHSQPIHSEFINTYVAPPLELMHNALKQRQAHYDRNKRYIDELIDWTFKLKASNDDIQFRNTMNTFYKRLREFDGKDLSLFDNQIRYIELGIREEIERFNEENNDVKFWNAGLDCFDNEDYKCAIKNLNRAIAIDPSWSESYFFRGISYAYLEDFSTALANLSKYILLEPNDGKGYFERANIKIELKDYYGALSDFNKDIELTPQSSGPAYFERGGVKFALKDYNGAILDFKRAITLDPELSSDAYANLAWINFNQNKFTEAMADANKSISINNSNASVYAIRGEIKFKLKDYNGCIEDVDTAINLDKYLTSSYLISGRAYYRLGDKASACAVWNRAGEECQEYISKYCN